MQQAPPPEVPQGPALFGVPTSTSAVQPLSNMSMLGGEEFQPSPLQPVPNLPLPDAPSSGLLFVPHQQLQPHEHFNFDHPEVPMQDAHHPMQHVPVFFDGVGNLTEFQPGPMQPVPNMPVPDAPGSQLLLVPQQQQPHEYFISNQPEVPMQDASSSMHSFDEQLSVMQVLSPMQHVPMLFDGIENPMVPQPDLMQPEPNMPLPDAPSSGLLFVPHQQLQPHEHFMFSHARFQQFGANRNTSVPNMAMPMHAIDEQLPAMEVPSPMQHVSVLFDGAGNPMVPGFQPSPVQFVPAPSSEQVFVPHQQQQLHEHFMVEQPGLCEVPLQNAQPVPSMPMQLPEQLMPDHALACTGVGGDSQQPAASVAIALQQLTSSSLVPKPSKPTPTTSIVKSFDESALEVLPALVKLGNKKALAAVVHQQSRVAQWEWARAVDVMGLATSKDHVYLKRNHDQHVSELLEAEINPSQLIYRGVDSDARGSHAMGSSAFMLMVLVVSLNKRFSKQIKTNACKLAMDLVKAALSCMTTVEVFMGIAFDHGKTHRYTHINLEMDRTGIIKGMHSLLVVNPAFILAWNHLMTHEFCGHRITSAPTHPSLWDVLLFLTWAKNFASSKRVWANLARFLWPNVLFAIGKMLDNLAFVKSQLKLQELPLLKSKKGKSKIIPWINKLVLFRKIKKNKASQKTSCILTL